jgi:hypothetical protein
MQRKVTDVLKHARHAVMDGEEFDVSVTEHASTLSSKSRVRVVNFHSNATCTFCEPKSGVMIAVCEFGIERHVSLYKLVEMTRGDINGSHRDAQSSAA